MRGSIALWVPADLVQPGVSITDLLLTALRRFHSALNIQAGDDAVMLGREMPDGLVLLVDDINRLPDPHQARAVLEAWCKPQSGLDQIRLPGVRFIIPLWPQHLVPVSTRSHGGTPPPWKIVDLGVYNAGERAQLAHLVPIEHATAARQIIEALNGDPFLCALAAPTLAYPPGMHSWELVQTILEDTLKQVAAETTRRSLLPVTDNEVLAAVNELVRVVLELGEPDPVWDRVRAHLHERPADILHYVSETNQLGRIEGSSGQDIWRWKHNRLRDAIVGRWLAQHALPDLLKDGATDTLHAWLEDPGLAEAWAIALVFLANRTVRLQVVELYSKRQPLALAEILRLQLFPREAILRDGIVAGLRQHLQTFDASHRSFVGEPRYFILEKLAFADDSLVLDATEEVKPTSYLLAARFRNGDVVAGVNWMHADMKHDWPPTAQYQLFEQALDAFAAKRNQQRAVVGEVLAKMILQSNQVMAALTLAGYLAWPELARPIHEAWHSQSERTKIETLMPLVWALSRCGDVGMQTELEAALLMVRHLRDEEVIDDKGHARHERFWDFMEPLRLAQRWPLTPTAAETWTRVAIEHPDLRKTLCYLLRGIDHPDALEAYVRWAGSQGGILWDDTFEPYDPLQHRHRDAFTPTTSASRERLWHIFRNDDHPSTQRVAFTFWKRAASRSDLNRLREVPADDSLFDHVLRLRIRLHDPSAVQPLIKKMDAEPEAWCSYAPALYDQPGVPEALFRNIDEALSGRGIIPYAIALHLPASAVKKLIREKSEVLRSASGTWQYLWRSDIPEVLGWVEQAVAEADPSDLEHFFGRGSFPYPVSRRMLVTMEPVLHRFHEWDQRQLAQLALGSQFGDWVIEQGLYRSLQSLNKHLWPVENEVLATLDAAARAVADGPVTVDKTPGLFQLELHYERQAFSPFDIKAVIRNWVGDPPEVNKVVVAAILLSRIGSAEDLMWWQPLRPQGEPARTAWGNTLYMLQRQRWHTPMLL